ncbi:MAG: HAMP domain-containing protein [Firmicutes bacterium]|nr:HAMP domain-containing protein [Bacillota bacterium]
MKIKTLKNKIILYFMVITIVPSILLTFFYYKNTNKIYEAHMLENAFDDIYYIKRSVDEKIVMAKGLADWFYMNSNFDEILTKDYKEGVFEYDYDIIKAHDQIKLQLINSPLGKYISALVIVGNNQVELRYGSDSSMIDIDLIKSKNWYKRGMSGNGKIYWPGIVENPAVIKNSDYVIPVVRPIYHTILNKKIGWMFMSFKEELISDIYINKEDSSYKYFVIDQLARVIPHQSNLLLSKAGIVERIHKILDEEQGFFRSEDNREETLYVYEKCEKTDWTIVEVLPLAGLNQQKRMLRNITLAILMSSLVFTSLLIIYLSFNLTSPLKKLIQHVNQISIGIFVRNKDIERQDEIGILGIKINKMAVNIRQLMDKLIEEEKEKRELELKALQNQINPHFLYNTLNSIKWMAAVQGAEGIRNIVVAPGRLLKNLSSNTIEKISLEKELKLLEDYIFIQQIRYKGRINFNIEVVDEEVLKYKIIKFILQPIVENSIFHGIEAKKNAGRIDLYITKDAGGRDIIIKIQDDGIGMNQEEIKKVLNKKNQGNQRGLTGIGLSNVNNRIKLSYGESYGIEIKSSVGEYTIILIRIPCQL